MPLRRHPQRDILLLLKGGDRRSVGQSDQVVRKVMREQKLFARLVEGMFAADALVRMRSADAAEKVTALHPEWLKPYRRILLWEIASSDQQEVRWHAAQMIPRLALSVVDRARAMQVLKEYLRDRSSIVRTFAMQALADLARQYPVLHEEVLDLIHQQLKKGTPAMVSRGRKLVKMLVRSGENAIPVRQTKVAYSRLRPPSRPERKR